MHAVCIGSLIYVGIKHWSRVPDHFKSLNRIVNKQLPLIVRSMQHSFGIAKCVYSLLTYRFQTLLWQTTVGVGTTVALVSSKNHTDDDFYSIKIPTAFPLEFHFFFRLYPLSISRSKTTKNASNWGLLNCWFVSDGFPCIVFKCIYALHFLCTGNCYQGCCFVF